MIRSLRARFAWLVLWCAAIVAVGAPARAADAADEIDDAIRRGRAWLLGDLARGRFPHESYPMGIRSLYLYALLKAGADPNDPAIRSTLRAVESMPMAQTYSVALHLMALDQWSRSSARVRLLRLGEGPEAFTFLGGKRPRAVDLLNWILRARDRDRAHWTYGPAGGAEHDYSNSQFAILGIEIGLRDNLPIPPELFATIAETFTSTMLNPHGREPVSVSITLRRHAGRRARTTSSTVRTFTVVPTGWGYKAVWSQPTFSMTCAGLSNLAVARYGLEETDQGKSAAARKAEIGIATAAAWIATRWDDLAKMRPGPGRAERNYYYTAYSLEKAGDLADIERFGRHDWYREEAEFLLRDQHQDGRWGRDGWEGVASSFALLFLCRATARFQPLNEIVATGKGDDTDPELVYVERLGGSVPAGSVLCAAFESDDGETLAMAEEVVGRFADAEKGLLVPTLIVIARSGPQRSKAWSQKALASITGVSTRDLAAYEGYFRQWEDMRSIERARDRSKADRLVAIARNCPWKELRLRALAALERLSAVDAIPDVAQLLQDPDPDIRERALACLRFLTASSIEFPARGPEAERKAVFAKLDAWLREEGMLRVRRRQVEESIERFLAPPPPAYAAEALEVLRRHRSEAIEALLRRLEGNLVDYRIFVALRAVTGEDRGLDPAAWRGAASGGAR